MHAGGPVGQRVDLIAHLAGWIVAGKTHLAIRTVLDQEILRYQVAGLHVRIVARGALYVAFNQLYGAGGVSSMAVRRKRSDEVDIVLQGSDQAEGVRRLHVVAEHIAGIHGSASGERAVGDGSADRHGAVVATETLIAVGAQHWRYGFVFCRVGLVHCVGLSGQLLVPEAIQPRVWRVTVGAGIRTSTSDRRLAAGAEIVHAHRVNRDLSRQDRSGHPDYQNYRRGQQCLELHLFPPLAGLFKAA